MSAGVFYFEPPCTAKKSVRMCKRFFMKITVVPFVWDTVRLVLGRLGITERPMAGPAFSPHVG